MNRSDYWILWHRLLALSPLIQSLGKELENVSICTTDDLYEFLMARVKSNIGVGE